MSKQQVADRDVERPPEARPELARLRHLPPALLGVAFGRRKRLQGGGLPDRVVKALSEMPGLLRGLARLLSLAGDLERDRARRHRLDRLCDQAGPFADVERPVELVDGGSV